MPFIDFNGDFDQKVKCSLFRFDCPDPFTLGDYQFNLLPGELKKQIEEHLKTCPHCCGELDYLKEFLKGGISRQALESREEKEVNRIIEFKQNRIQYTPSPIKSGIRGSEEKEISRKITITISQKESCEFFFKLKREKEDYTMSGQFIVNKDLGSRLLAASVEIWQHNKIFTTTTIDDFCSFKCRIKDLSPALVRIVNQAGTLLCFTVEYS